MILMLTLFLALASIVSATVQDDNNPTIPVAEDQQQQSPPSPRSATSTSSSNRPQPTFSIQFLAQEIPAELRTSNPLADCFLYPTFDVEHCASTTSGDIDSISREERGLGNWERTTSPNGTEYLCYIPGPEDVANAERAEDAKATASTGGSRNQQQHRKPGLVSSDISNLILAKMAGHCATKTDGYWTYEVCWNAQVRQFHMTLQADPSAGAGGAQVAIAPQNENFLGKGPQHEIEGGAIREDLTFGEHPVHGPYLSTRFYNGTVCDLDGAERQTEILLFCLSEADSSNSNGGATTVRGNNNIFGDILPMQRTPQQKHLQVLEPKSCQYQVMWWSKEACIPLLRPEQGVDVRVQCFELLKQKLLQPPSRLEAEQQQQQAADQILGDGGAMSDSTAAEL